MLRHRSSRAVKLALYMRRFTGRRIPRSVSNCSRLKIMIKCRKRSEACKEIENFKKKNTSKNRTRDVVVPLIDCSLSNGVAEMTEKIDDQNEIVARDERSTSNSGARERLQNYRLQVAGNVWIPDTWGYEDRLKDWADPKVFDLHSNGLVMQSARTALIEEDCGRDGPAATILPA